jgi:hypothetical protein
MHAIINDVITGTETVKCATSKKKKEEELELELSVVVSTTHCSDTLLLSASAMIISLFFVRHPKKFSTEYVSL